mgnify:CR=1 FL=1
MTHQAEELEKQAEVIKKFEDAYNESSALVASKDEEISSLAQKEQLKSDKLDLVRLRIKEKQAELSSLA